MLIALVLAAQVATAEAVAEIRVHGNHTTPDAEVLALAGDVVGQPATDALIAAIGDRIEKSGRFAGVEVRKRYRSIDNPNEILLMIVVDERAGVSEANPVVGPWKRFTASGMWLPVLHYADGYGFTYGAQFSFMDLVGKRSRVSVPLTWGGERQAQVELERSFERGRIAGSGGISRRENPFYQIGDTRTGARVRFETAPRPWARFGAGAGVDNVRFGEFDDRLSSGGVDAALDTRVDSVFPRNAVLASVKWERVGYRGPLPAAEGGDPAGATRTGSFSRTTTDLQGYLGLWKAHVFAVRARLATSSDPPPPYEQLLLGGTSSLRGYDLGYRAGDNLATVSTELRMPITSPVSVARLGLKGFYDWGTVYPVGAKLADQRFDAGYGGGMFLTATVLSMGFDVAWRHSGGVNFHFSMGAKLGR